MYNHRLEVVEVTPRRRTTLLSYEWMDADETLRPDIVIQALEVAIMKVKKMAEKLRGKEDA